MVAGITIIASMAITIPAQTLGLGTPCARGSDMSGLQVGMALSLFGSVPETSRILRFFQQARGKSASYLEIEKYGAQVLPKTMPERATPDHCN
jgi:hypothetical protein